MGYDCVPSLPGLVFISCQTSSEKQDIHPVNPGHPVENYFFMTPFMDRMDSRRLLQDE